MKKGRIGIMPIGALNIAFASYIQGIDTFIESRKTHYNVGRKLTICIDNEKKEITLTNENYTNDINSLVNGRMPEIILFSPPNHRLMSTLDQVIAMFLKILEQNAVIPKLVMLSNGIYYDDVMNHVTTNFGSIDNNIREKIKGNIIRGTTLQTGIRIESEKNGRYTIFKPGTKGSITIAGAKNLEKELSYYLRNIITLFLKWKEKRLEELSSIRLLSIFLSMQFN